MTARATSPATATIASLPAATPHRGLSHHEPLLNERGRRERTGVDLPAVPVHTSRLGSLRRRAPLDLPGLSEPEAVRHYTRLSRLNHAIDLATYPLGSCTMKHNPRLNEKVARLPGLAAIHPLQPVSSIQGALALMDRLSRWLCALTGMPGISLAPRAGAHGELCGLLAIRAAHRAHGQDGTRRVILVPTSAHGTNPATAALCGYRVESIPATAEGRIDRAALESRLGGDVAAVMITNPNTCGLFEREMAVISAAVHVAGAFVYGDGANLNALVGKVRPGDLGIDALHINLHKTCSTPHGGGGPGSGPVVFSPALARFAPPPYVRQADGGFTLVEDPAPDAAGRMAAFHGQFGTFVRAYAYLRSHGADGLKQVAEDAVLSANYLLARLRRELTPAFDGPCMHECCFDDRFLDGTGLSTLDLAKALLDQGFHPMTMYFPLVVHGALLIEPTETESKADLDELADAILALATAAKDPANAEAFHAAPIHAPVRRLDETRAARTPVLRWAGN